VRDNLAFVAVGGAGLQIMEISDAAHPRLLGTCSTPGSTTSAEVAGDLAYVSDGAAGLQIINVQDSVHPIITRGYGFPGWIWDVEVKNALLLLAGNNELKVLAATGPSQLISLASAPTKSEARQVQLSSNQAWVVNNKSGLEVFELQGLAPQITLPFQEALVMAGANLGLSAGITGFPPLTVRWLRESSALVDGGRVSGATSTNLAITGLVASDAGAYQLVVSNAFGVVSSPPIRVSMREPPRFSLASGALKETNGAFGFQLTGLTNTDVLLIEATTNLVDWTLISSNTVGTGLLELMDPEARRWRQRFYRAKILGHSAIENRP
jgi:hypothetical protein